MRGAPRALLRAARRARVIAGQTGTLLIVVEDGILKELAPVGFELARIEGRHHIYRHDLIAEQLNLQEVGGEAKPYQVRQFLRLVERYDLRMEGEL